ncbi:MAG: Phage late control protein [Firmicutes bacterium]|nr:Phage late control protein [Bacillota bacterium]
MTSARQATVKIVYNAKDITKNIAPFLLDFEYTDNESHKADDIQLTLEDKNQLWMSDWLPTKGDTITASIIVENWFKPGDGLSLPCGTFSVDEVEFSGPPHIIRIKGVSVPTSTDIRGQAKTKAWEKISLKSIAEDLASAASLTLMYESDTNPQYLRIDQVESSDLAFLQTMCEKACVALKVTDNKIVIFDERTYEEKDAVWTINRKGGDVISFSLKSKTSGTAKAGKVTYSDPLTGKTVTGTYSDDSQESGVTINVNDCPDGDYDDELASTEIDEPEE